MAAPEKPVGMEAAELHPSRVDGSRWFGWAVTCERDGVKLIHLALVYWWPLDLLGRVDVGLKARRAL